MLSIQSIGLSDGRKDLCKTNVVKGNLGGRRMPDAMSPWFNSRRWTDANSQPSFSSEWTRSRVWWG